MSLYTKSEGFKSLSGQLFAIKEHAEEDSVQHVLETSLEESHAGVNISVGRLVRRFTEKPEALDWIIANVRPSLPTPGDEQERIIRLVCEAAVKYGKRAGANIGQSNHDIVAEGIAKLGIEQLLRSIGVYLYNTRVMDSVAQLPEVKKNKDAKRRPVDLPTVLADEYIKHGLSTVGELTTVHLLGQHLQKQGYELSKPA